MDSNNIFSDGMEGDLSKLFHKPNSYIQALNFRPVGELGSSNGSLVNIKGNECKVKFPTTQDIFKLQITDLGGTNDDVITITVNGQTTTSINTTSTTTGFEIYTALKALSNAYQSTHVTPTTATFNVAYSDNYVIISQQPVYSSCSPVNSIFPTTTINRTAVSTKNTLMFFNSFGIYVADQLPGGEFILTHNNLYIIGSTFIDNDIYLLVSDEVVNVIPDNDSFTGVGSIWKLSIDDITKDSTLTLLYTNYLDFSIHHPVPPSAILGRYESANVQRIYWTDFYNKIRTVEVSDPQLMALNPQLLSIFPAISFELPLLYNITSGSLSSGTWELGYRLKKFGGAISNFSQTSNMVQLLDHNPNDSSATSFKDYEGPSGIGNSGRGITWQVNNIDTSYDTIEYILVYRSTKTDLPVIYIKPEENIGSHDTTFITITDVSGYNTMTLDEFLIVSSGFTHAKTVDTKDNRLFWGNVRNQSGGDISARFDARAFRAKTAGVEDIILKNDGIVEPARTFAQAIATPITNDSINEYYDILGEESVNACFYQPGTSILGGTGANISYSFGTKTVLMSDMAVAEGIANEWHIDAGVPFSNTSGVSTPLNPEDLILGSTDSDDQLYPIIGVGGMKNPYVTSLLKAGQHEEIYRYGIQFFDLQGIPYFTEWIGDIKMPGASDTNTTVGSSGDFRNSFLDTPSFNIYGQIMFIEFTVDVTSLQDFISGYQIVRVERTQEDKTILGTGMLTNSFSDSTSIALGGGLWMDDVFFPAAAVPNEATDNQYDPYPSQDSLETLGQDTVFNDVTISSQVVTFDCFDFINSSTGSYDFNTGDKVLVRSKVSPINRQNAHSGLVNPRYRKGFDNLDQWLTNSVTIGTPPSKVDPFFNGGDVKYQTGFDSDEMPYYLLFYVDTAVYASDSTTLPADQRTNHVIITGQNIAGGNTEVSVLGGSFTFKNSLFSYGPDVDNTKPGYGSKTILLEFDSDDNIRSSNGVFNCSATNGDKLMALYYRPKPNQYGGSTYSARTNNEYIACGSYIPITRDSVILTNNLNISFECFGGDIHLNYWDHQKIHKSGAGTNFRHYAYDTVTNTNPGSSIGISTVSGFNISNTYMIPCTNVANQNVRYGEHVDKGLTFNTYAVEDEYNYQSYHSNEKNVRKFFPKPLSFRFNDEWRARVFYSAIKFDNEPQDSWTIYSSNDFHDCEGSYGGINALITLNSQIYYLQDRAVGHLLINPIAMIDGGVGAAIKLGNGEVIQKHNNIAIDIGTSHQWSVYRSQSQIMFLDVRHKKLYLFDGQSINPISDKLGQRNYFVKRLHDSDLKFDNPIIDKGILTTYDYYNNEFLITINNDSDSTSKDGYYTLAFNEQTGKFASMYSFLPNIYINSNKYLFSNINRNSGILKNSIYLHNYSTYGIFYGTLYPSTLKVLVNDNPLYTKIFDNLSWISEAIQDNLEWSDDLNILPGAITSPAYPDDINYPQDTFTKVRCYNQYQNTDFTTLTLTPPGNIRKTEQGFMLQIPRNKFNYDTTTINTKSLFDPSALTKVTFGERIRDKWMVVDLYYPNSTGNRFIIHNLKTTFRVSDR